MNQIIQMLMRMFGRKIMNAAMKKTMGSTRGTGGQRRASSGVQNTMKNSQKAMKILRRLR